MLNRHGDHGTTGEVAAGGSRVAYTRVGSGPALLLIHGWPFDRSSFAGLLPALSARFTCYLPDTPGLGATEWTERTDFSFGGQARALRAFADALGLSEYAVVAHDTGGTIARLLAADDARLTRLVLLNTEMPGHRPPWIPLFRHVAALPGAAAGFAALLSSRAFVRSTLGFGGCFHDRARLDDAFVARYVTPLLRSRRRLDGALRYLRGIDWGVVDGLRELHGRIPASVLLVWGAEDDIFPLRVARHLPAQLRRSPACRCRPGAFLVHEERPEDVARASLDFL